MSILEKRYPLVSIITLNYNGIIETLDFLESCKKLTYPNIEILVCDMNSIDNPTIKIEERFFQDTFVYRSDKNLGFAEGNNWGMRKARGSYFFIVNNDTFLTPNIIESLLKPFEIDNKIGFVCPKIKFFKNPEIIQYAGFNIPNFYTGRNTAIGSNEVDKGQYDKPGYTNLAHGCAMMVKREITEVLGKFPKEFFLYYEEIDWSLRLVKAGYRIFYQPEAVIYHKESMSVGKESPLKIYYMTKNRILLIRRHANNFQFLFFCLYFIFISFPFGILRFLYNGQYKNIQAYLKGIIWNFKNRSICDVDL